jgi:ribosomal protein S21
VNSVKNTGPGDAVQISFVEVRARQGEAPERMIKRFTRAVRNDGVLQEVYERRSYMKPSVARRKKKSRSKFLRSSGGVEK